MQDNLPKTVTVVEVGPRDGLQNEKTIVDTASKIHFIEQLANAGLKRIEITAFVSPRWIPPLADQMEVALGVKKKPGVRYAALVPNVRGYERAMSTGAIDEVSIVVAASNQHNLKNLNADTAHVMQRYHELAERAHADSCPFRAYISCSFGCPYEGPISPDTVLALAEELLDLGAYELSIGDTIGIANPLQCYELCSYLLKRIPASKIALHMHDTRGMALANIFQALRLGIATFDSSAGGLGGCPYAPGAAGNVASEDLVNMLSSIGLKTGIDLKKLCESSMWMENLLHRNMPSKMLAMCRGMELQ
jgi:hydroxymethylglutaryl-CoA lyase